MGDAYGPNKQFDHEWSMQVDAHIHVFYNISKQMRHIHTHLGNNLIKLRDWWHKTDNRLILMQSYTSNHSRLFHNFFSYH